MKRFYIILNVSYQKYEFSSKIMNFRVSSYILEVIPMLGGLASEAGV